MKPQRSILSDLDDLLISDYETDGRPVLPAGSRERVEEKLARLIVTRELLQVHLHALGVRVGQKLRHADRLPDDLHQAVIRGGPAALDDATLAKLALNPVALCALRDDLLESPDDLPEAWWALLEREGRDAGAGSPAPSAEELLRRAGVVEDPVGLVPAALNSSGSVVRPQSHDNVVRWWAVVPLQQAEWVSREDIEEARRLEAQEVRVEFSWQDRPGGPQLQVRLRGALRLGYSVVRCGGRLTDPTGARVPAESVAGERLLQFVLPPGTDPARLTFECDYRWPGSYHLRLRVPLAPA